MVPGSRTAPRAFVLLFAASSLVPAAPAAATDLDAALAVATQEIVTGAGVHHVVLWPSELEGYVDREGGEKTDFALTMGNYLPKDLGEPAVPVQLIQGLRQHSSGAGAVVGFHGPSGDVTIDSAAAPFSQARLEPEAQAPTLARFAAFPFEADWERLQDLRFLGARLGIRAYGRGSRSAVVPGGTDGRGWRLYTWKGVLEDASFEIQVALSPERRYADYSFVSTSGAGAINFGKRSPANRDQVDPFTQIIWHSGSQYPQRSRTNVDLLSGLCLPDAYTVCLNNSRFQVTVDAVDFSGVAYRGHASLQSGDSADFWFFSPNNREVFLKILDACSLSGNYWEFWSALSNVAYTITVVDTRTGQRQVHTNPVGYIAPAVLDTNTIFRECGTGSGEGLPTERIVDTSTLPPPAAPTITGLVDPSLIRGCHETGTSMCLQQDRFQIEGTWWDFQGNTGPMRTEKVVSDSGYGWFFDVSNKEIFLKVLDACSFTGNYWVFTAGLTNVQVELRVIDTETGKVRTQINPAGQDFPPSLDTATFFVECPEGLRAGGDATTELALGVAPPDSPLEAALETVHDRLTVETQPDGSCPTVPEGLVVARPDFAGRIVGAELYGVRSQWGPNGFSFSSDPCGGSGTFRKYGREPVNGATLRILPSETGVGYALALDENVSTLDPTAAHELVHVSFDGKAVTNEPGGVHLVTGVTTEPALVDALKVIYSAGAATPQQVQSLMLIPHTTRTMACADQYLSTDCDEYSGATVSLKSGSTEDLQIAGRFKGDAYLDVFQDERWTGGQLDKRTYSEDGHSSLSTFAAVMTRPALGDYFQYNNTNPFFTLQVFGNASGGSIVPPDGKNSQFYSSILSAAPVSWTLPQLPFD